MSGGQMQRVAIARAIVNDPDIILADEPTGALDTETSIQVMDILKEIAKDRLVIMVTHNPELAEKYSTRIVRMLDGVIISDSKPIEESEKEYEESLAKEKQELTKKKKMPSMSFITSFGLSLKNLFTKKGRTMLTAFAGSIGIIGIALIYAVSQGTTNYINMVQEQTLSSYPLSITETSVDITSLMTTFMGLAKSTSEHENDAIYQKAMVYELVNALNSIEESENDLTSFKSYIEEQMSDEESKLYKAISAIKYSYNLNMVVYTQNVDGQIIESDTTKLMMSLMAGMRGLNTSSLSYGSSSSSMSSYFASSSSLWQELVPGSGDELISGVIKDQYDVIWGNWPTNYNEIVLFVDDNNELDDLTLYALGLKTDTDLKAVMQAAVDKTTIEYKGESWSYEEIGAMDFRVVLPSSYYSYDQEANAYIDLRDTSSGPKYLYDNALKLKVVGIAKAADDAVSAGISGSIGYTCKLTEYVINEASKSDIVKKQIDCKTIDVISGLMFKPETELTNAEKNEFFKKYVETLNESEKAELYKAMMSIPKDGEVTAYVDSLLSKFNRAQIENLIVAKYMQEMSIDEAQIRSYISQMSDDDLFAAVRESLSQQYRESYAENVISQLEQMTEEQLTSALAVAIDNMDESDSAKYYDETVKFANRSYDEALINLGCIDLNAPSTINLYAVTFADKDLIKEAIDDYNENVDDVHKIEYTDLVGILMSSITTIIDAITYVLISFVSVSLIVSSIMIGVITLISVQERTKEIGILRAIGASKKNVSSMFNAETVIIGFVSGLIGVVFTYIVCVPINIILHKLTGINTLSATLPPFFALFLVLISVLLTLVAGIIPSRSAAKKDPVVALRTE